MKLGLLTARLLTSLVVVSSTILVDSSPATCKQPRVSLRRFESPRDCGLSWSWGKWNEKSKRCESRRSKSGKTIKTRLAGARESCSGEFPGHLFIHRLNCSGVLLNKEWGLTTARCLGVLNITTGITLRDINISFGNKWPDDSWNTGFHPTYICVHTNWTVDSYSNYAVFKINKEIDSNTDFQSIYLENNQHLKVNPVCLPKNTMSQLEYGAPFYAIGFGANGSYKGDFTFPKTLQALEVKFINSKRRSEKIMYLHNIERKGIACASKFFSF